MSNFGAQEASKREYRKRQYHLRVILSMKVEIANVDDLNEILELQVRAYQSEAEIYNDYSIEPLIETPL